MITPNENQMVIIDSNQKEHLVEILFEYENKQRNTKYVLFFELDNPDEVMAMKYTDEGELIEIDDDEEFDEVLEVFNAFQDDEKKGLLRNL